MQITNASRPRVSRETRLLLTIVLASLAALWVLARLRFPDRAVAPNPVPPVLAQLAPESAFDNITSTLIHLHSQLSPSLVILTTRGQPGAADQTVQALRIRPDAAVALIPDAQRVADVLVNGGTRVRLQARDPASHLAVLRVPTQTAAEVQVWTPRRTTGPRFLVATVAAAEAAALRPVFVASLSSATSPAWREDLWILPADTAVDAGTFLFTLEGSLVGMVVPYHGLRAILPGGPLLAAADRLLERAPHHPGYLGVSIAPLTPEIATATGSRSGVVITWIDPKGPAAGLLQATDVIETLDDQPTATPDDWRALAARAGAGASVALGIRRSGATQTVRLTAAAPPPAVDRRTLGLTMRRVPGVGAEVLRVQAGSAADEAGIEPRDVVTRAGQMDAPSPADINRAFTAAPRGTTILVALVRDGTHHVVAVRVP